MDVREKLVELLLQEDDVCKPNECKDCGANCSCYYYRAADRIIEHGIMVQEWVSVKDRLPAREDATDGGFVLANTEEKVIIALWSDVCRFNEFVTHWMPMPQPPKGD